MNLKEGTKQLAIEKVTYDIFYELMLFIYTNQITDRIVDRKFAKELSDAAYRFRIRDLGDSITSVLKDNPSSIPTYSNEGSMRLLLNAETFSDLVFLFDNGKKLYAHKVIIIFM